MGFGEGGTRPRKMTLSDGREADVVIVRRAGDFCVMKPVGRVWDGKVERRASGRGGRAVRGVSL